MEKLPFNKKIAYAAGMLGWSVLINLISVILVYLFAPPAGSGLPTLISQIAIFGFFNVISIITAGGRLIDAFYDPFIAQYSDRSIHPKGRRIPIMRLAIVPSVIFCFLVFYPLQAYESTTNGLWLFFMLVFFYISSTSYIIPYNALLPEFARSSADKVQLSTFQSLGYVIGIGVASNAFNLCALFQENLPALSRLQCLQITAATLVIFAGFCMLLPVLLINEKKYSDRLPATVPLKKSLLQTLHNSNFRLFIVADFSYFVAVTIITSGLLYFVTVLLLLPESTGNKLMITMVGVSLLLYPLINYLTRFIKKKILVTSALLLLSAVFLGVYFLGKIELSPLLQIYLLIVVAAIPLAILNILPNAILAEIITTDSLQTGENKEAMFFAVRYFFVKIAQTFGIAVFAMLLLYGKDVGDDRGLRFNGLLGFILCAVAAAVFLRFKEDKIQRTS